MRRFKSIVFAAVVMAFGAMQLVPAQTAGALSSAALSIVPKKNYTVEPGKSIKDTLVVRNLDANRKLELNLRVVDFTYTDDGGTPKLMLAEDAPQTTWSLKPFLTVPKTVTIPPKTSKTLNMDLSIPKGHGAGSYYSAIVYSSGSPVDGGNVGLSASGVTLVFTSIPGKVNEDLQLQKFGAYSAAKDGSKSDYVFFATDKPEMMAYTLKNNGNVTEAPTGSITIRDLFGNETVINDVNPSSSLALIGQTRTYTACIKLQSNDVEFNGSKTRSKTCTMPGLWPGIYTAKLDLYYGQNGNRTQEIHSNAMFWYFPWWFIIIMLIVLVVIAYFVWRIVHAVRAMLNGQGGASRSGRAVSRRRKR